MPVSGARLGRRLGASPKAAKASIRGPSKRRASSALFQPPTIGFITYSEGCNDDVNKIVWSALGWNPDQDVTEILRQYSRYFIGDAFSESFAQGLAGAGAQLARSAGRQHRRG